MSVREQLISDIILLPEHTLQAISIIVREPIMSNSEVSEMEEKILKDIIRLFVDIRFSAHKSDKGELKNYVKELEEKNILINRYGNTFQKNIFTYCFNNLIKWIERNDYEIVGDFADAVHNLPEIFYLKYDLREYWKTYIEPVRKKYGNQLFMDFKDEFNKTNIER